jgi:hypothetical protein
VSNISGAIQDVYNPLRSGLLRINFDPIVYQYSLDAGTNTLCSNLRMCMAGAPVNSLVGKHE